MICVGTDANLLTVSGVSAEDIKRSVEDCVRRAHEMKAERKVPTNPSRVLHIDTELEYRLVA